MKLGAFAPSARGYGCFFVTLVSLVPTYSPTQLNLFLILSLVVLLLYRSPGLGVGGGEGP